MGRFGDGIGTGADLRDAGTAAVAAALAPLAGRTPDLALVFVSGGDPAQMGEVAVECSRALGARAVLGCTASGVVGGGRGVEGVGAVSAFAAVLPGVSLRTFHLEVLPADGAAAVMGLPERSDDVDEVALLLADAYSFPVSSFVSRASAALPGLPFVGGVADGPRGAGSARLWVDGRVVDRGAVGVVLTGASAVPLLSQGCRPVGPAMTVTGAHGNVLLSLAGEPAVDKVRAVLASLAPPDQALASDGLRLGIAADEYTDEHDYVVRAVLGTEPGTGGLFIGDLVQVGQTVRLQVRDADTADADLREVLAGRLAAGGGALLFSCAGRGEQLFGPSYGGASHDIDVVRAGLGADAVAGFFTHGEIGPVAGLSQLNSSTAAVLLLP